MKKRLETIVAIILVALIIAGVVISWELTLVAGGLLVGGLLGWFFGYHYRRQEEIKDKKDNPSLRH